MIHETKTLSVLGSVAPLVMVSLNLLQLKKQGTPEEAADYFAKKFKETESLLNKSRDAVAEIQNRSWLQSLFNSDSDDLVRVSQSQQGINEALLQLIQEVNQLNTRGYDFLIKMIHGLESRMRDGWLDTNGQLQTLSSNGQSFAETAKGIFLRIAEGVRESERRLEEAQQRAAKLDAELALVEKEVAEVRSLHNDHVRRATAAHERLQLGVRVLIAATATLALAWTVARVLQIQGT